MTDENLAYHADAVLKNPAFLEVVKMRESQILEQLLAVKGWMQHRVEAKRKELLDDLAAVRRVRSDLELMARPRPVNRASYTA